MGQKILVVEDNELNLKLFCDLLRAHGYEAEPVRDGREAVARARSFGPELVIMDIQMPYITGLELIEQMKADEELKRTPIMAVTAYAAKGDEQRIRDAGAEGYVSKPISLMRFIEAVRGLLGAAEAERAEEELEPETETEAEEAVEPAAVEAEAEAAEVAGEPEPEEWPAAEQAEGEVEAEALDLEGAPVADEASEDEERPIEPSEPVIPAEAGISGGQNAAGGDAPGVRE